ncbi:MAG: CbiX/SirB N-terminal domain-containing protein [Miltoncostaeaceae bacterium]
MVHPDPLPDAASTGLVLVDHGSRVAESNDMLLSMAAMVREVVPWGIVEPAHMELAEPSIATAFGRCVERGAQLVVVSPYFLLPGRHWSQDIPALAAEAAEQHPETRYLVSSPLGLHPLMADVVRSRVEHCLAHATGNAEECESCSGTGRCELLAAPTA